VSGASERFTFLINGIERTLEADGRTPLLDALRNTLGLKGTRFGCGNEECGACFVLVDGHAVPACMERILAIAAA
jgi:nicotinate dehydrogenase subunit A